MSREECEVARVILAPVIPNIFAAGGYLFRFYNISVATVVTVEWNENRGRTSIQHAEPVWVIDMDFVWIDTDDRTWAKLMKGKLYGEVEADLPYWRCMRSISHLNWPP